MKTSKLAQSNRRLRAVRLGTTIGVTALLLVALLWGMQGMATHAAVRVGSSPNPLSASTEVLPTNPIPGAAVIITSGSELANPYPSSHDVVTYTIRARAKGGSAEAGRITNLEEVARQLSEMLEDLSADWRLEFKGELTDEPWSDYRRRLVDDFKTGQAPDIILSSHEDIAAWAAAGYVRSLTNDISLRWTRTYSDFYPALWDAVTWNRERWAIPQDTEARLVFFRKDALRALGWTDMQIAQTVTDTLNGDFTLNDMVAVAQEAVQADVVEWSLFHRSTAGPDFYILPLDYGGALYNSAADHLVLSKCPTYRSLTFFSNLANVWHVTPMTMTTEIGWDTAHQTFVDGDVLFWFGDILDWATWRDSFLEGDEQYLFDNVGYMLYPATRRGDDPLTLSHPMVYMISSQSVRPDHSPDLVFDIVTWASAPELVARHAVDSGHLAVRRAATQEPGYQADAFLQAVSYMLDYTTFSPNHEQESEYRAKLFAAISAVETGSMTPDTALTWLENELQTALGSELEIDIAPCFNLYLPLILGNFGP